MDVGNILNSTKQMSRLMLFGGILGVVFGGIHLFSFLGSGSSISLGDAIFNASFGLITLLAGWLLGKDRLLAIPVTTIDVIGSIVYSFLVGRGFNFVVFVVGVLLIGWMIRMWRRGVLK